MLPERTLWTTKCDVNYVPGFRLQDAADPSGIALLSVPQQSKAEGEERQLHSDAVQEEKRTLILKTSIASEEP